MPRASESQKAERLNRARDLLLHVDQLSDAVDQLARDCSISPRQAYRYVEQAQRLKEPVPPSEAKLAFTVKLPLSLVRRVRTYAAAKGLSISEVVTMSVQAQRCHRSWRRCDSIANREQTDSDNRKHCCQS
jgi:hypothetical protein